MPASFAFAGSGEVDPGNAAALLDDLLPQDGDDGTPGIGSLFRPVRVPRSSQGLTAAVQWVETELGKRAIKSSDDLIRSLLERRDKGEDVTLVMVWPAEPTEEEIELVKTAQTHDIPVKNLAAALDDLLWEDPEPEPGVKETATVPVDVTEDVVNALGGHLGKALELAIRAIVADEIDRRVLPRLQSAATVAEESAKESPGKTASKEDVAKVAAKLSEKPEELDDDELEALPPFDPPFRQARPGDATGSDDTREAYYMNEDGKYRRAKARPRRGEKRVMLTLDEIDQLAREGAITGN